MNDPGSRDDANPDRKAVKDRQRGIASVMRITAGDHCHATRNRHGRECLIDF
ncbi:hypothetical protein [Azospirillum palustre]